MTASPGGSARPGRSCLTTSGPNLKGGITFGIYGLTAKLYHYSSRSISDTWEGAMLKAEFIEDKLGRPQDDEISILLAHNPKYFQEYVEWGAPALSVPAIFTEVWYGCPCGWNPVARFYFLPAL